MLVKFMAICDEQNRPTQYFDGNLFGENAPRLYTPSEFATCHTIYGSYFSRHPNQNVRLLESNIDIPALQSLPPTLELEATPGLPLNDTAVARTETATV